MATDRQREIANQRLEEMNVQQPVFELRRDGEVGIMWRGDPAVAYIRGEISFEEYAGTVEVTSGN